MSLMAMLPTPETRPRRWLLLVLLALAHLGLWWAMADRMRPPAPKGGVRLSELRLIAPRIVPAHAPPPLRTRSALQAPGAHAPARVILPPMPARPLASEEAPAPLQAAGASAPMLESGSLLDSEATRRALRQAARAPLLSERAAAAMGDGAPLRPEERLGQQVQQAASGDCLKGEFAGAGMGLLSLPFWALAEARGKCRR
jgi:hypothetical protein